jgi:phage gp45-like
MMDAEDIAFMRAEIKRQVQLVLFGSAGTTTSLVEDIQEMMPGMGTIPTRPVSHPYGFVSRAMTGTISCVIRCGDHAGNRMIFGHRDQYRPMDIAEGETAIYSSKFYQVRCGNAEVRLGFTTDNTDAGFAGQSSFTIVNEPGSENLTLVSKLGQLLQFTSDGSVNLVSKDGSYLSLNATNGEISFVSKDGNVFAAGAAGITIADKSGKNSVSMDGSGTIQVFGGETVVVSAGQVNLKGGAINLGNTPIDFAVLCNFLVLWLNTHTHEVIMLGAPTSPPLVPAIPASPLTGGTFGSSAVQVSAS